MIFARLTKRHFGQFALGVDMKNVKNSQCTHIHMYTCHQHLSDPAWTHWPQLTTSLVTYYRQIKWSLHSHNVSFSTAYAEITKSTNVRELRHNTRSHCSIRDLRLSPNIVSRTAWKTNLMFSVSMAVVKWWKRGRVRTVRRSSNNLSSNCCTSLRLVELPENDGKYWLMSDTLTLSASRSVLFRKRIIETCTKDLLLTIVWKMLHDSTRRLVQRSSNRTWSYSLDDARNRMDLTLSKHWYQRWRCERCPPTSTKQKGTLRIRNSCSDIPLVAFLAWSTSWVVGM